MVCVIELELGQCGDHRATAHECIQQRINATHRVYREMMEECRMLGASFPVYSILDRLGYVVAEIPVHNWGLMKSLSCVKSIRESKLHQQLSRCDNQ